MPSIILWDDSFSQSFELELQEQEHRVRVAFRFWLVESPEAVRTKSGKRSSPRGRAVAVDSGANDGLRCLIAGESSVRLDELARGADRLAAVATFLGTHGDLEPLGREFRLRVQRNVFVPQVRVEFTVDGNAYLPHGPVVPGHSELTLRFWVSDDELLAFAEALDDEAVALGASSRWAARQPAAGVTPAQPTGTAKKESPTKPKWGVALSESPEPSEEEEAVERAFFWEEYEESLSNVEKRRREEEEWERLNEEWVRSHMRERQRRAGAAAADEEEKGAAGGEAEEATEADGNETQAEPFVELPVLDEAGGLPQREPERPSPSEEAEALAAIREAKEGGAAWLELEESPTRDVERAEPHVDTRTGLVWPAAIDAKALDIPGETAAEAADASGAPQPAEAEDAQSESPEHEHERQGAQPQEQPQDQGPSSNEQTSDAGGTGEAGSSTAVENPQQLRTDVPHLDAPSPAPSAEAETAATSSEASEKHDAPTSNETFLQ